VFFEIYGLVWGGYFGGVSGAQRGFGAGGGFSIGVVVDGVYQLCLFVKICYFNGGGVVLLCILVDGGLFGFVDTGLNGE